MGSRSVVAAVALAGCIVESAAPPTTPQAQQQASVSAQQTERAVVPPMGPCQKHPVTTVWKWTLVDGQCALVASSVRCGRDDPPPSGFDSVADCDAASHVTTRLVVVELMAATGKIAEADASRSEVPPCAVGLRAGAACAAKDYGVVCASAGGGLRYLACVLPQAPPQASPADGGNVCYGMCNRGPGTTTYLGVPSAAACTASFALCGAPP